MTMPFLALAAGTLLSEDLTCILAGTLIYQGAIDPWSGVAACALGIYLGDLGLYGAGRALGSRVLTWRNVQRYLPPTRRLRFKDWFAQNTVSLVLGSRFVPGTRLPLYVTSGAVRSPFRPFAVWSAVAVALWTPALVFAAAASGNVSTSPWWTIGGTWVTRVVGALALLLLWRLAARLATRRGRQQAAAAVSRLWRWEFWPMWIFYAPAAVWIAFLIVRHRGLSALGAANPGMPDGGIVGESKHDILSHLPPVWTIPSMLIPAGPIDRRIWQFLDRFAGSGWAYPLIFKPDVGQRGAGVRIVQSAEEARSYLAQESNAVLVQPYHEGPFEAGVFYYRMPGTAGGRIFSITDKQFPVVEGDGHSTLEELIWGHPRLRMQAARFLARHADRRDEVLHAGQRLRLVMAGNHCQGTLFRDGGHLITRELEACIDGIAASYPGFYIGRFDIRYRDVGRFMAGKDLAIVELNGATAESTNIYDPERSLVEAYRQLFRQWSLVFAIGAANRARGAAGSSAGRVFDLVRAHLRSKVAFQTAD